MFGYETPRLQWGGDLSSGVGERVKETEIWEGDWGSWGRAGVFILPGPWEGL